jgi:hypothetical protein
MKLKDMFIEKSVIPGSTGRVKTESRCYNYYLEVYIEEGIEVIEEWAISYCTILSLVIPSTVKKIEGNPFRDCHIYEIICKSPYYSVKDGILMENTTGRLVSFVDRDCPGDTYTIPYYIRIIGKDSFEGHEIGKIIIPDTVEEIGANPFVQCYAKMENHSPNYTIENGCLIESATNTVIAYVGKETDIVVPQGVTAIGKRAFEQLLNCELLTVTFPSSLREIPEDFGLLSNITSVYVPEGKETFYRERLTDMDVSIECVVNKKKPDRLKDLSASRRNL